MTFPLPIGVYNNMFSGLHSRPKTVVIEEILKDSLRIEHDIEDVQKLVNELENIKSQEDMMKHVVKIQKDLQDIYVVSKQVYADIKELVHY